MTEDMSHIEDEIKKVQLEYIESLSEKEDDFQRLLFSLSEDASKKELQLISHKTAGSGGTYNCQAISKATRYLENILIDGSLVACDEEITNEFATKWLLYFHKLRDSYQKLARYQFASTKEWSDALSKVDKALDTQWDILELKLVSLIQRKKCA